MSNTDPFNNYDTPEWEAQNATKMDPNDPLTGTYAKYGFDNPGQYQAAFNIAQPTSPQPTYGGFDNSTSAINNPGATPNVSYNDWANMDPSQQTAVAAGRALAAEFGLENLDQKMADWVLKDGIKDPKVLYQNLYSSPEFAAEYPELAKLKANGLPPLSPQDIIDTRAAYNSALASVGIDPNYLSKDQKSDLIVKGVSPKEVQSRLNNMVTTLQKFEADPTLGPQFQRLYAQGVTPGELAAFYLEPDHTEGYFQKQVAAASAAARSQTTGFGQLNLGQAEMVGGLGLNDQQLSAGFGDLAMQKGLLDNNASEGGNISVDTALQAGLAKNAPAQEQLQRRLEGRKSAFSGGGNFADPNKGGLTGAGTSNS